MKKINLSLLEITMLDGSKIKHDFAKELAQVIFQNTQSIEEHSFSIDLYKNPEIELTDENKRILQEYTPKYFKAFVQSAVNKLLNDN